MASLRALESAAPACIDELGTHLERVEQERLVAVSIARRLPTIGCPQAFGRSEARESRSGDPSVIDKLLESWLREEATPFAGWDFSHLKGRWDEEHPPWSYESLAREALRAARSAVDLGTGGGERLARSADVFPRRMFATEAYPPNLAVARDRLAPLGVTVVAYRSDDVVGGPLPFATASMSAVLDRHESYDAAEVERILEPGGLFLTQQVHARSLADLREAFGVRARADVTLERLVADPRAAGLEIERSEEWWGTSIFHDVGAVVYALRALPWEVPSFSVRRYETELRALQDRLEREGSLGFRVGRLLIAARKPLS